MTVACTSGESQEARDRYILLLHHVPPVWLPVLLRIISIGCLCFYGVRCNESLPVLDSASPPPTRPVPACCLPSRPIYQPDRVSQAKVVCWLTARVRALLSPVGSVSSHPSAQRQEEKRHMQARAFAIMKLMFNSYWAARGRYSNLESLLSCLFTISLSSSVLSSVVLQSTATDVPQCPPPSPSALGRAHRLCRCRRTCSSPVHITTCKLYQRVVQNNQPQMPDDPKMEISLPRQAN